MLRAIETRYAGYRFRSRLEARHAVLLDHLSEPWEYEKEGFELPSGRYLPDFWLPRLKVWLEVKGHEPNDKEKELTIELANESSYPVLISVKLPSNDPPNLLAFLTDVTDGSVGVDWWELCWSYTDKGRLAFNSPLVHRNSSRDFYSGEFCGYDYHTEAIVNDAIPLSHTQLAPARAARFEFHS